MTYADFLARKVKMPPATGLSRHAPFELPHALFPFQRALVEWALRRGRAAIFAGTGLGKTLQQLAWANQVCRSTSLGRVSFDARNVLILAPLAVARQTAEQGERFGVPVTICREAGDVRHGINITNYDRLHKFDPSDFGGVALDESSIIKHHTAKTLKALLDAFRETPFKLCCTATPAPNDWTELGNHAEFLGVCTRQEMLSEFFVHDGGETQKWRLKGHARGAFWRWVASWAALVTHPRDLGFEQEGYDLPPLTLHEHLLPVAKGEAQAAGLLFVEEAGSLMERRTARKVSIDSRVRACVETVAKEPGESWVIWCDLNAESDALAADVPGSVEVRGAMDADEKEAALDDFGSGKTRTIITKASIAGWGLNWQHCARVAFVGVTDSWESYYQAIRRCWRFGQTRPVEVHIFASEAEGSVVSNLKAKDAAAAVLAEELARETRDAIRASVLGTVRTTNEYEPAVALSVPAWLRTESV